MITRSWSAVVALIVATMTAGAQQPPAIRPLGPITHVSTQPLGSVATAVPLADGRVFVNDVVSRRVLLFDATLATAQIVADSTSVTAKAYGARPGGLIRFHGDSALFLDPSSGSMPVLSPAGKIARVMAIPQIGNAPTPTGGAFGLPTFDTQGRMVFGRPAIGPTAPPPPTVGRNEQLLPDSAFIVRFDFESRVLDTLATLRTPKLRTIMVRDADTRITAMQIFPDLLPLIDEWTMTSDGALAVVRGRDYHVDWRASAGSRTASPKMPFTWEHLDDGQKTIFIDSSLAAMKARRDSLSAARASGPPPPPGAAVDGGRGGGGRGAPGGASGGAPVPVTDARPELGDIPDYRPPFTRGGVYADADGNLWIRTTTLVKGQPVYDIVNRRGELTDRVQLPAFRTIAGFAPGVVYMAVKDANGVVHLERARVK